MAGRSSRARGIGRLPAICPHAWGCYHKRVMSDELEPEALEACEAATHALRGVEDILFITGAGLSADSGLPTYRGLGGLYDDRETEDAVPIEVALSGPMFVENPAVTWKYIRQIEAACRGAKPNRGHELIAALEQERKRVWVLSQNVDGLHARAGSVNRIDIHGDLRELHCTRCAYERFVDDYQDLGEESQPGVPGCPECGSVVRPRVVLFGEMLPHRALRAYDTELGRGFGAVVSVGTTSLFPYIAQPVIEAARGGVPAIEINPTQTLVSDACSPVVRAGAAQALEAIVGPLLA